MYMYMHHVEDLHGASFNFSWAISLFKDSSSAFLKSERGILYCGHACMLDSLCFGHLWDNISIVVLIKGKYLQNTLNNGHTHDKAFRCVLADLKEVLSMLLYN